jgi:hypothetical protein
VQTGRLGWAADVQEENTIRTYNHCCARAWLWTYGRVDIIAVLTTVRGLHGHMLRLTFLPYENGNNMVQQPLLWHERHDILWETETHKSLSSMDDSIGLELTPEALHLLCDGELVGSILLFIRFRTASLQKKQVHGCNIHAWTISSCKEYAVADPCTGLG